MLHYPCLVCHVNITLNNKQYKNSHLEKLENQCSDVLLGLDFQKQHAAVTFLHCGTEPELKINEAGIEVCSLTASKLRVLWLFANLKSHAQPIATKSRVKSDVDRQFTAQEIKHPLAERIVEPSPPWRAQVVLVKGEVDRHKNACVWTTQTLYRAWCIPITKNWNLGKWTCRLSGFFCFRPKECLLLIIIVRGWQSIYSVWGERALILVYLDGFGVLTGL